MNDNPTQSPGTVRVDYQNVDPRIRANRNIPLDPAIIARMVEIQEEQARLEYDPRLEAPAPL